MKKLIIGVIIGFLLASAIAYAKTVSTANTAKGAVVYGTSGSGVYILKVSSTGKVIL
jgi:hypothetical protein